MIDLNSRKIIDLLFDRESKTIEDCFRQRQYIRIATRDSFGRYAKGVPSGSPQAVQIADL
ncbi:hypothetical protein DXN04_15725 [Chitinophaga silvisoli]|uniref:Uncharacterized protein n=1 Tax=Chitinophaga silvisoli TaxID=2291814 RepID=A0A3E1P3R1_9BACT|nr:hypothetical protein DXN04_15725 [Chitinophaga silvisoli]